MLGRFWLVLKEKIRQVTNSLSPRAHLGFLACLPQELDQRYLRLGVGFGVQGSGFRVRIQGSGFRVQGSGFRVQGFVPGLQG